MGGGNKGLLTVQRRPKYSRRDVLEVATLLAVTYAITFPGADRLADDQVIDNLGLEGSAANNDGYYPVRLALMAATCMATDVGWPVVCLLMRGALHLVSRVVSRCTPDFVEDFYRVCRFIFTNDQHALNSSVQHEYIEAGETEVDITSNYTLATVCHDVCLILLPNMVTRVRDYIYMTLPALLPVAVELFGRKILGHINEDAIKRGEKPPYTPADMNSLMESYGYDAYRVAIFLIISKFLSLGNRPILLTNIGYEVNPKNETPRFPKYSETKPWALEGTLFCSHAQRCVIFATRTIGVLGSRMLPDLVTDRISSAIHTASNTLRLSGK